MVVVPRWFLVWYNKDVDKLKTLWVVVPRWFLVWYNYEYRSFTFTPGCSSPVVLGMV